MDKSDSKLHCEQIEKLMAAGRFKDAVFLADKVDWRKEEDNKRLIQAAEVYRKNRRFDDAINILKMAHNRKPNNKKIVFLLCEIYFENKDVVTAQVYLDRYQSMTDKSDWHYDALKYKRALAYDLPVAEKIDILLELKAKEPAAEQFRYELAELYRQARQYAECGAECDELLILFGDDGNYARKALELKKGCIPLTDEQESLLKKLMLGDKVSDRIAKSTQNVQLMNTMDMSAMDLENKLAEDIRTLKSEDSETKRRKRPEFNTKSLQQTIPPSTQEVFFSDKTEDIHFTQEMNISNLSGYTVKPNGAGDIQEVRVPYSDAEDFDDENQNGQGSMDDLLTDWNRIKARNTENMKKNIHNSVVESTGKIFEKKKEDEEQKYFGSVTGEIPGSIWKEVDLGDEFDDGSASESEEESLTEDTFTTEEPVIEAETIEEVQEETAESVTKNSEDAVSYEESPEDDEVIEEAGDSSEEQAEEMSDEITEDVKKFDSDEKDYSINYETTNINSGNISFDVEPDEEEAEAEQEESEETEEQNESDKVKELSPEERKLFAPFLYSKKMRTQIVNALENITLAAYTGNVIITTDNNDSGFALAKSIVKFVKFADTNFSGAMSKIDAEKFNKKNVSEILDKLNNGALVIERANRLSNNSLIKLTQGIYQEERGIVLFLVDTKIEMKKLLNRQRTLTDFFNIRIDIVAMNEDALVDYGMKYAGSLGYSISDGFANMAFHRRIRESQAGNHLVTTSEVKEIIDDAIRCNEKNFFSKVTRKMSKKYKDDEGRVLLCEKDFD